MDDSASKINLADIPPFIASHWINVGKTYPTTNTPYEVVWARARLLRIPNLETRHLPAPELSVKNFLGIALPQESAEIITTKAKLWFSRDEPTTDIKILLSRPIPPKTFITKLESALGQAWFDGAKSVVDVRFNNGTERFPFWIIAFWRQLADLVQKQNIWREGTRWLEVQREQAKDPMTIQIINDSREVLKTLPFNTQLPRPSNNTSVELAIFLSDEKLWDQHVDMIMQELTDQVASDPALQGKVVIAPLQFSAQVLYTAKAKEYTRQTAPLLCRYAKHIKENQIERFYFPLHINGNHWIPGLINFAQGTISFGKLPIFRI